MFFNPVQINTARIIQYNAVLNILIYFMFDMFVPLEISKINCVFLLLYLWHPFGSSQSLRKSRTQPKWLSVRHPEKYGASGLSLRAVSTFLDVRFCFVLLSSWWRFGHLQMFWKFPGLFCTFLYQFQVEWNIIPLNLREAIIKHKLFLEKTVSPSVSLWHIDCLGDSKENPQYEMETLNQCTWRCVRFKGHAIWPHVVLVETDPSHAVDDDYGYGPVNKKPVRGNHFLPGHLCVGATDHGLCVEPWFIYPRQLIYTPVN